LAKQREDRLDELEDRFAGYTVYDVNHEKIGKVDDLFVDEDDNLEYVGMKTGFLGTKSTLIPVELVRMNDRRGLVKIEVDKDLVKDGPSLDDAEEITPEYEHRVRKHYGLDRGGQQGTMQKDVHDDCYEREEYYPSRLGTLAGSIGQGRHSGHHRRDHSRREDLDAAAARDSGSGEDDELRVQRVEEELRAGTREREAGTMRVRKRVRTERARSGTQAARGGAR
jgi:hypothetical protein